MGFGVFPSKFNRQRYSGNKARNEYGTSSSWMCGEAGCAVNWSEAFPCVPHSPAKEQ
jgi:hypothetical protein